MSYVDFKEVRELASIDQVATWLHLDLKNNRTQCPKNEGDKRELVITPEKGLFHCFGCKHGGDSIELTAHVLQISQKEAALEMQKHFHGYEPVQKGLPKDGLDYLESAHPLRAVLGVSKEVADAIGAGFAPRGTMRGYYLFPLRRPDGALLGYIGCNPQLTPPFKLPKDLK